MIVYEYPISGRGRVHLALPIRSDILSAGFQEGQMVIWVAVYGDPQATVVKSLLVLWTGEPVDENVAGQWEFIQTLTSPEGLVYHIFQ